VVPIDLPPLRDRLSDIPALVDHFLALAVKEGLPRRSLNDSAIAAMQQRSWRGNVRELRNLVFRAVIMSRDDLITADALQGIFDDLAVGGEVRRENSNFDQAVSRFLLTERPEPGAIYDRALAAFEIPLLQLIMRQCDGNQVKAAAMLGINRNTLRKKLVEHALVGSDLR